MSTEKKTIVRQTRIDIDEISDTIIETIEPTFDSLKLNINFKPKGNYSSITNKILTDRVYFKDLYDSNPTKAIDSAAQYLYSKLLNDIVPHWYGTDWDFNGHTDIPNEGEIACGYFVSTTLKHFGFNLNRYKMAQQAGLIEARMLQTNSELKIYRNLTFESLKEKVNSVYHDGIYFVGLDNHVGYVLVKNKELYFLHSSYCDDKVVVELAKKAYCFSSNIYVFAEISTNKNLIKRWILNERLNVPAN
ncbi:hypothetical protein [Psychroserpens ponticola]|uniref:NlpC/P60 domain-containing protein n=1 Tax=Psychroserpens ponticola TaxID=2932268 RepID=A0ABY7RXM1_9FLAO|nr:hypothetical protein [Psychroserpens ponticola]WCO01431.1 hypothetical protein MUN68_015370 [Psychroserpens ponticola]